jgi:hypothetical protein
MLNQIFEYTIRKIKYSNWLKSILNKLFLLSYEKIIGDTYSKLWKFNNRVNHFMVLESSILYSDNNKSSLNANFIGYKDTRVHSSIDVFLFNNAEVNTYTGLINIDRRFYFTDLFVSSLPAHTHIPMFRSKFEGRVFVSVEKNYYHFITEELYPIIKLTENGISFKVINPGNIGWKNDLLTIMCPNLFTVPVKKFQYITADEVIGVTKDKSGYIHPNVILTLRNKFRELSTSDKKSNNEYIYISRRLAPSRRVKNEDLLEDKLTELGFNIIFTEDYSLKEKIEIFKNCKLLVSLHGAGLTNMITLDEESCVIELIDKTHFSHCYNALSNIIGLKYYSQLLSIDNFGNSYIDIESCIKLINSKILIK